MADATALPGIDGGETTSAPPDGKTTSNVTPQDDQYGEECTRPKAEQDKICAEAAKRYVQGIETDKENRDEALFDTKFVWDDNGQWPDEQYDRREIDGQPCLQMNQLPQFIKQVVNDQRQNPAGIRVSPASGDASVKTAEILQGMVRYIEYDSQAQQAYDSAFEQAVTGGRGYWRVLSEYLPGNTFDQKLIIKRIPDFLSVVMGPYNEPDTSDKDWCFVTDKVPKDAFKQRWPDADPSSWDQGDEYQQAWNKTDDDDILTADYYRRTVTVRKMLALSDGNVGYEDEIPKPYPPGVTVKRSRECEEYKVEWFKIAGGRQILAEYQWKGTIIPVVPCIGDELVVEGKIKYQGLIRRARDPQMMYNYAASATAERIALAPKAPYIMAEGQDESHELEWKNANKTPQSALFYKPTTFEGQLVPPPQRAPPIQAESGLIELMNSCKADLRSTIGIYDPSLGQHSNEISGKAILAREKQGDTATYHFVGNRDRAVAMTGRICVELIPFYYDSQRIVSMLDEKDEVTSTPINVPGATGSVLDGSLQAITMNDVSQGAYAVTISSGPAYASKLAESAETMMQLVQSFPQIMPIAGDLVIKSQNLPLSDEIAERMEAVLPPPVIAAMQAKDGGQQLPPAATQKIAQLTQQLQQAQGQMQQLQQQNQQLQSGEQTKMAAINAKAQADAASDAARAQADAAKAAADRDAKVQQAQLDADLQERIAKIKTDSAERIAIQEMQLKERIAEIQGGALVMSKGMEAAMSPIPDALPGETPTKTTQPAAPAAPM